MWYRGNRNPMDKPYSWHRNPDDAIRQRQRSSFSSRDIEAEKAVLIDRIRVGELSPHHVELAAYLGDEASLLLFTDPELPASKTQTTFNRKASRVSQNIQGVLRRGILNKRLLVTVAADFAERVLPIWEAAYPEDDRPRLAIEAARNWIDSPPAMRLREGSAWTTASDAAQGAFEAYEEAEIEWIEGSVSAAGRVADAAGFAAATASGFDTNAARTAVYAASAARKYVRNRGEEEWQLQHLIEVLLS